MSPRNLMIRGMVFQIFLGCFAGLVSNYEVHMLLRYLTAVCCAQMYTAGQVIRKIWFGMSPFPTLTIRIHSHRYNWKQISNYCCLFFRKFLVNRCYYSTGYRIYRSKLVQHFFDDFNADHFLRPYLVVDTRHTQMVFKKRTNRWGSRYYRICHFS